MTGVKLALICGGGNWMFDISYTDWKSVCEMCCNLKQNTCKAYLQWFPFAGLPYQDKKNGSILYVTGIHFVSR